MDQTQSSAGTAMHYPCPHELSCTSRSGLCHQLHSIIRAQSSPPPPALISTTPLATAEIPEPPSIPTALSTAQLTPALHTAPTPHNPAALTYPHPSRISSAAMLFIITAQLTAEAEEGKSYGQMRSRRGKSLGKEEMRRAVEMREGDGLAGLVSVLLAVLVVVVDERERRVRMGRWKARVSAVQRRRKKRYCRRTGWVARKFVMPTLLLPDEVKDEFEDVVELSWVPGIGGKGGSGRPGVAFSMRAHVR